MRALIVILLCLLPMIAYGQEWSDTEILNAIYKAEGGAKAEYPYGIRSVKTNNPRQVCLNTIRNNRKRYAALSETERAKYQDYLHFLQTRYCPTSGAKLTRAERSLNGNWLGNVRYFLRKGAEK